MPHLTKHATKIDVQYVEILADKVYVEYTNYDSDYVSFNKAKNLLKDSPKELIRYNISDNQKALDFINSIPKRTTFQKDGNSYLKARV